MGKHTRKNLSAALALAEMLAVSVAGDRADAWSWGSDEGRAEEIRLAKQAAYNEGWRDATATNGCKYSNPYVGEVMA
jgi:hypothetical protein